MFTWEGELNKAIINDDVVRVEELLYGSFFGAKWRNLLRCIGSLKAGRNSLLHLAAYSNSVEVARLLIEKCEDINYKNGVGDTPLHVAAYYNAWETADLLISSGALINVNNEAGRTPLDIAVTHSNNKLAELLRITVKRLTNGVGESNE